MSNPKRKLFVSKNTNILNTHRDIHHANNDGQYTMLEKIVKMLAN